MYLNYISKNLWGISSFRTKIFKEKEPSKKVGLVMMLLLFMTGLQAQTTFTTAQSGNFTDPATWGTVTAPTSADNVVITAGKTVTLDDWLTANNVTITGSLESSSASGEFIVSGNLTVNSDGLFKGIYFYDAGSYGWDKGMKLSVAGNITNNGRIDLSAGTASYAQEGVLNLNGSTVQTVSGIGTFGGTNYVSGSGNTGAVINQLVINNTSTATPNVVWEFDNIKIGNALTLTSARVALGSNKMTIGNYGFAETNSAAGNGFLSGTIGRWYGAYDSYSSLTAGSDYNDNKTSFPFINPNGKNRSAFITRPNDPTYSATAGELTVTYYDDESAGVSSGFSVADGAYTITDVYGAAWIIGKDANYAFPVGNHAIAFSIEGQYSIKNGNSRILLADGYTIGTHQKGTTTPFAQRVGLSDSDLVNVFQVGYNSSVDTPVTSVKSGSWNDASVWSNNAVPSCTDTVSILPGHTVTVNSVCTAAGVNISAGATLISASRSLTVGCTNNNASFSNSGTYILNGGSLIVNGNIAHGAGSTFNQTGGDIVVDGNNNGSVPTSSELTLFKIASSSVSLTAGKITIVDPPVTSSTLVTTHTASEIIVCTGFFCWYPTSALLDSVEGLAVGQIVVGAGIPAGTKIVAINLDGTINTSPSLPATGLSLPLNLSFYNVGSSLSAFVYESDTNCAAGAGHTLQIGNGVSAQKGAVTTNGFSCNFRAAAGTLSLNNLTVNAPDASNRFVNLENQSSAGSAVMNVQNDFIIVQGTVKGQLETYFGGNVVNNGSLNLSNTFVCGNFIDGVAVATSKPQTISGSGTFISQTDAALLTSANSASVGQLRVNNTSAAGVTFLVPFSVVSSITMTAGIIHTSTANPLKLGVPAMTYGTNISGNFGDTCFIDGPFIKDFGTGQNANNLFNDFSASSCTFPVGKKKYAPVMLGVTTVATGTAVKVEAFETNSGTPSSKVTSLSQHRWEVSKVAGTFTDFIVRVGDATSTEKSIIVQAPSANGVYDNDFGITSIFVAATPNTVTTTGDPIPFSALKGFISTARQASCSTANPGNTLASQTTVCAGKPVTLSLQNVVVGEGITYQWQSSTAGSAYSNITDATATTCNVAPVANTNYRCNVSCSFSSTAVASTPVLVSLNNTITATTPATICSPITTATLSATSSAGTVKWYDAQAGGTTLGTGTSFTTPAISATTTYYAGTESTTDGTAGLTYGFNGYGDSTLNKGLAFNLTNSLILNSVKVYPQQNPGGSGPAPITIKVFQNGIQVPGTSEVTFTPIAAEGYSPSTVAQTVDLNFQLTAGDNYTLLVTDGISYDNALAYASVYPSPFPILNGAVAIVGGFSYGATDPYSYSFFYDWDVTEICSSARVPVTATVKHSYTFFVDADHDGIGSSATATLCALNAATPPVGYSVVTGDCNDSTVSTTAVITSQPNDAVLCSGVGSTASFTVGVASATSSPSYKWQYQAPGKTTWTDVINGAVYSGANTVTLTVTKAVTGTPAAGTKFKLMIFGGSCPANDIASNAVALTSSSLNAKGGTVAVNSGSSATICKGSTTILKVGGAVGDVQWQSSGSNDSNGIWTNVGTPGPAANLTTAALSATTYFRTKATSDSCSLSSYSNIFQVTVSQQATAGVILGGDLTICSATGSTTLSLFGSTGTATWYRSTNGGVKWSPLTTTSTYVVANLKANTMYKAIVANGSCSDESLPVSVNVTLPAKVGAVTASTYGVTTTTVCVGEQITFGLASSVGSSYQWEISTTSSTLGFAPVSGATATSFTMVNTYAAKTKFYARCVVSNAGCTAVTSAAKTITVNAQSIVGIASGSSLICSGDNSTLTLTGYVGKIQWMSSTDRVNYSDIVGAVSGSYTASNVLTTKYYKARVTNSPCSTEYSNVVTLTTGIPAVAGTVSGTSSLCNVNTGTTLTLVGNTGNIQWQKATYVNNVAGAFATIAGKTAGTLDTGKLTATTVFRAVVKTGSCSSAISNQFVVSVAPALAATITSTTTLGKSAAAPLCTTGTNKVLNIVSTADTIVWQRLVSPTVLTATQLTEATTWATAAGSANSTSYTITSPATGINYFRVKLSRTGCSGDVVYSKAFAVYYTNSCGGAGKTNAEASFNAIEKASFNVMAYPNPYAESFKLNLTTSTEEKVGLVVYDMTGRLLEQREVSPSQVSGLQIGDRYPSGVYNVIVTQGSDIKTLRVIKQ